MVHHLKAERIWLRILPCNWHFRYLRAMGQSKESAHALCANAQKLLCAMDHSMTVYRLHVAAHSCGHVHIYVHFVVHTHAELGYALCTTSHKAKLWYAVFACTLLFRTGEAGVLKSSYWGAYLVWVLGIWSGEGMRKGWERGGQFTSNLGPRWAGSCHSKEGFQVSKGVLEKEPKGISKGT